MSEYRAKYKRLKAKLKYLVYEQECFVEEMRKTQRKLVRVSRDKSFLLDRLIKYETVPPSSSDDEATASSSSDDELQNEMKAAHPKAKKRPNDDTSDAPATKIAAVGNVEPSFPDTSSHRSSISEDAGRSTPVNTVFDGVNSCPGDAQPSSRVKKMSTSERDAPADSPPDQAMDQAMEHDEAMEQDSGAMSPAEVRGEAVAPAAAAASATSPTAVRTASSSSSSDAASSSASSASSDAFSPVTADDEAAALHHVPRATPDQHRDVARTPKAALVSAAAPGPRPSHTAAEAAAVAAPGATAAAAAAAVPGGRFSPPVPAVPGAASPTSANARVQLQSHPAHAAAAAGPQQRSGGGGAGGAGGAGGPVAGRLFHGSHTSVKHAVGSSSLPATPLSHLSSSGGSVSVNSTAGPGASQCKYMLDETAQCTESVNMKSKSPFCTHHRSIIRKKGQAQSYNAARKLPRIDATGALVPSHAPSASALAAHPSSSMPQNSHGPPG